MRGTLKWFCSDKGFGYVIGDGQLEYYLSMKDIRGAILPRNGDSVSFEAGKTERRPRAFQVVIVARGREVDEIESHVKCQHCQKSIVPRMIVRNENPDEIVCPFCGKTVRFDGGYCFLPPLCSAKMLQRSWF